MEQPIMRKRGIYGVIVAIIVVGLTTFSSLIYIDRMQLGNRLQGRYQKELYDLIGNVQNLETDLAKVTVTSSPTQSTLLFGDIWRQAGAAADRINSIPITHAAISETSKLLAQISDFSYALVRNVSEGKDLTEDEMNNLEALRNNAAFLREKLYELQNQMEEGGIGWAEIKYGGNRILGSAQANLIDTQFQTIDKQMEDHPTLIYDGPFAENVLNITPRVASEPEITMDQAKQKVIDFIGYDKVQEIGSYSEKGDGTIPTYPFYVVLKDRGNDTPVDIDISKNGGHVVYMLDTRSVGQPVMEVKEAIDRGLNFLTSKGYNNMIPLFSQRSDNILVVNYVYTQKSGENNVVIYPDQIKLKIALDNGDIVGIEAEKYLASHTTRDIPEPKISVEQARAKASPKVQITNTRLAVIPLLSKREVFCYEFIGRKDDSTYAIYINAENGNEENILQIIDTPEGELAM